MKIDLHPADLSAACTSYDIDARSFRDMVAEISTLRGEYTVYNVPGSWAPLFSYMSIAVGSTIEQFPSDAMVAAAWQTADYGRALTASQVTALCSFRPETMLALLDLHAPNAQVSADRKRYVVQEESGDFLVNPLMRTTRRSITDLLGQIELFYPKKPNALILPNDPTVIKFAQETIQSSGIEADWYIIVMDWASGMVPEDLIQSIPAVDSVVYDDWTALIEMRDYFSRTQHKAIVTFVPSDMKDAIEYGVSYSSHQGALFHAGDMGVSATESRIKLRAALLNHTAPKE